VLKQLKPAVTKVKQALQEICVFLKQAILHWYFICVVQWLSQDFSMEQSFGVMMILMIVVMIW
jgi:hypothetical protein